MAESKYRRKGASAMALPNPGLQVDEERTAHVITDLQKNFLIAKGGSRRVVGEAIAQNSKDENLRVWVQRPREKRCTFEVKASRELTVAPGSLCIAAFNPQEAEPNRNTSANGLTGDILFLP